jgi:hypothetical protein
MKKTTLSRWFRKWHRKIGVIAGIQLLFWTISGAYFAWTNIEDVRGNFDVRKSVDADIKRFPESINIDSLLRHSSLQKVRNIATGTLLNQKVLYLIQSIDSVETYDLLSGKRLSPVSPDIAIRIVKFALFDSIPVSYVGMVNKKKGEYKGPVPAYRIDLDHWKKTHVYVHIHTGQITAKRNVIWRIFDFLWMFHILDFQERENINNWILRIFSLLGIFIVISGFGIWVTTTPLFRKKRGA